KGERHSRAREHHPDILLSHNSIPAPFRPSACRATTRRVCCSPLPPAHTGRSCCAGFGSHPASKRVRNHSSPAIGGSCPYLSPQEEFVLGVGVGGPAALDACRQ